MASDFSFTLQEILYYAQAYSQYKLLENTGFPFDQTTDTISGLGSIVIPQNLTDNVSQLHEFLFGDTDYTPSDTVSTISSTILATVDYSGSYDYSYSDYDDGSYSYDDSYYDDSYSGDYDESGYEESSDDTSYDDSYDDTSYDDGYEDSGGSGYDDTDDTSGTESSAEEY